MTIPVLVAVSQATYAVSIFVPVLKVVRFPYLGERVLGQAGIENGVRDLITVQLRMISIQTPRQ
jgi:hypothetical protein